MLNKRRRQESIQKVVPKDNLKQTEAKGCPFQNKKNKIMGTQRKWLTNTMDELGVDHAARTQCLEFYPNGRMKK